MKQPIDPETPIEPTGTSGPRETYTQRRAKRAAALAVAEKRDLGISAARFVVGLGGVVAAWLSIQGGAFPPVWLLVPALVFGALMVVHERTARATSRLRRSVGFYDNGLRRIDFADGVDREPTGGRQATRSPWPVADDDPRSGLSEAYLIEGPGNGHLYAGDLDVFGKGSLFEFLSQARTRAGHDCLAEWLCEPAPAEIVRSRQEAVAELRDRLDLRENLAVLGGEVEADIEASSLVQWAQRDGRLTFGDSKRGLEFVARFVLLVLGFVNVAAVVGWAFLGWGVRPMLFAFLAGAAVFVLTRKRVESAIEGVDRAARDLEVLAELLEELERDAFRSGHLKALASRLLLADRSPGREVVRLQRLVDLLESRRNALFAPLGALVFWTTQLAFSIDGWRARFGSSVGDWLSVVGEFEALSSLATYSFENPEDPFPELVEARAGSLPVVEAEGLGHPLLPRPVCVRNDVRLGSPDQALVISGSNMSGKSTYLRTTGTAIVMALMGAPVRAKRMRITPVRIGASIQIQDSLQEGASKFYAEITRLRDVLALTEAELPLCFLLDEILHGTNSHDRRIGAEAVLRALLGFGAIGMVTTHDLALSRIVDDETLELRNVHFQDDVREGSMVFDYRLREGVVERSNALALMREVGLKV